MLEIGITFTTILKIYKMFGAKASFFVNGLMLTLYPDLVRILDEGHLLVYHGYRHVPFAGLISEEINRDIMALFRGPLGKSFKLIEI